MGNEANCKVRFGKQESEGKALLETSEILFRGEFRLKIPFATIKSVKATGGELRVQTAEGLAVFHLGPAAEKWRDKILHPKSRIEKLGVKPGAKVSLLGQFDPEFLRELGSFTKSVSKGNASPDSEWIFVAADAKDDLALLSKISKFMEGRRRPLDRLSQRPEANHGKRRPRRRPQGRLERRKSRRLFRDTHRAQICHSAF